MQERDQLQGDLAPVLDAWPISGVQYRKINMFILPMPIQRLLTFFKKNGPNPAFSQHNDKYSSILTTKRVDDVLGTRTWGGRMVGADESTEV